MKRILALLLGSALFCFALCANAATVTAVVTSAQPVPEVSGNPLPGSNVKVWKFNVKMTLAGVAATDFGYLNVAYTGIGGANAICGGNGIRGNGSVTAQCMVHVGPTATTPVSGLNAGANTFWAEYDVYAPSGGDRGGVTLNSAAKSNNFTVQLQ